MRWVAEIELGNDAMTTIDDVFQAVGGVRVACSPLVEGDGGALMDANGNTVGGWKVVPAFTPGVVPSGAEDIIPIPAAFISGLARDIEDLSGMDETGRLFQLSENVRKATRRAAGSADLVAIKRTEDIAAERGNEDLAGEIYALGLLIGGEL